MLIQWRELIEDEGVTDDAMKDKAMKTGFEVVRIKIRSARESILLRLLY